MGEKTGALQVEHMISKIDPHYFRPSKLEAPQRSKKPEEKLGCGSYINIQGMCRKIVVSSRELAKKHLA
jgi:hypothetical protein